MSTIPNSSHGSIRHTILQTAIELEGSKAETNLTNAFDMPELCPLRAGLSSFNKIAKHSGRGGFSHHRAITTSNQKTADGLSPGSLTCNLAPDYSPPSERSGLAELAQQKDYHAYWFPSSPQWLKSRVSLIINRAHIYYENFLCQKSHSHNFQHKTSDTSTEVAVSSRTTPVAPFRSTTSIVS
ncbi:hypothetical protein RUM44_010348 [Polyplax serrata]|uniref:Uncharacterized protein n=1 Tax=Polyplax serrata TaxID=468196 RepID=A0ABR1AVB1_POLSC